MSQHPSEEKILMYLFRRPDDEVDPRTTSHLEAGCETCASLVQDFQDVISALCAPGLEEAPGSVRGRALAWLELQESSRVPGLLQRSGAEATDSRARRADAASLSSVGRKLRSVASRAADQLREMGASLVLDTFSGALLPGIRGAAVPTSTRQLMFESSAGQVYLQIEAGAGGSFRIHGQFTPTEETSLSRGQAMLVGRPRPSKQRLSETGEFDFASVPAGETVVRLEWDGHSITLAPISLTRERDD